MSQPPLTKPLLSKKNIAGATLVFAGEPCQFLPALFESSSAPSPDRSMAIRAGKLFDTNCED